MPERQLVKDQLVKHQLATHPSTAHGSRQVVNPTPVGGVHCIAELFDCNREHLDDAPFLERVISEAAEMSLTRLLKLTSQVFQPQGVTVLGLLAESHISIHTWPELGYAAMDAFTCHQASEPQAACEHAIQLLGAQDHEIQIIRRGLRKNVAPKSKISIRR